MEMNFNPESREIPEEEIGEIVFNIDVMLAVRKMSVSELAEKVGITLANMSILKTGKAKAVKVSTLSRICEALDCQPGDILEYRKKGARARYMENRNRFIYSDAEPSASRSQAADEE